MKKIFFNTEISVERGDIWDQDCDVVINGTNENLELGADDESQSICAKAGVEIQRECDDWIRRNGPVRIGTCAYTGPGYLRSKYIIHAVGPGYRDGKSGEPEMLTKTLASIYDLANKLNAKSLALPAISNGGSWNYPLVKVAAVFFTATINYLRKNITTFRSIAFINADPATVKIFEEEFKNYLHLNENVKYHLDVKPKFSTARRLSLPAVKRGNIQTIPLSPQSNQLLQSPQNATMPPLSPLYPHSPYPQTQGYSQSPQLSMTMPDRRFSIELSCSSPLLDFGPLSTTRSSEEPPQMYKFSSPKNATLVKSKSMQGCCCNTCAIF
mmetsp:Transcript_26393/g.47401  ORF Transcript_26393/g.47401 Transcript_26393/m.47401 type:complete len:326 (+) Transcript_26393:1990-2967(+)